VPCDNLPVLRAMITALGARGRGVARELLGSAEWELKKNGFPCIVCAKALHDNLASIRLFESNGYKRIESNQSAPVWLIKAIGTVASNRD